MQWLRELLTNVLAWLGLLGRGWFRPPMAMWEKPDPDDPEFQPVINADHPLFDATVERLDVKRCIGGEYQWFTVIALDPFDERLGGVKLHWELEGAGVGTIIDMPNWMGETRDTDGASRFFHAQRPARYRLVVEGVWLVENVRTDLPWMEFSNGYKTYADPNAFENPGLGGWLAVLRPGHFAYWVMLRLKA